MLKYWIAGLLVVAAFPAMAQETPVSAVCQILKTHNSTAAYQPGVDVNGKSVAPADLNAPINANLGVIEIPVEVNLVQKFNMMAGNGIKLEPTVSTFKIFPDGRVMYGNQDVTQNAHVACGDGAKSSAILPPPQPQEPGILGTLTVNKPAPPTPAPEAKPPVETAATSEAVPNLIEPVVAPAAPQEVPLADQYCLQNGYTKKETQPGFVAPILPVPVQPPTPAAQTLSAPVPSGGEIIKAVPYENDEIPGLTNNKTVPNQPLVPEAAPAIQNNISVSTVPAQNPLPKPRLLPPVPNQVKSPETIPTFSNPIETRAAPSLPVRDIDKPLARPPGMPIESSWAPPPPKSDALSAPTMIVPPPAAPAPFEKTEKAMTAIQAAPAAASTAAHPSKALRIDTNPLRRNLEETP